MKIRLFLATLCIFMLPLFFGHSSSGAAQFSTYAAPTGYWVGSGIACECDPDVPECICTGESLTVESPESNAANTSNAPVGLGSGALFGLAAIMLWLRFKP